jgi:excisionase family DNA binding protein
MAQPAQLNIDSTLWTANDVASYLKVSRSWVYHRAESGELPYVRVGALLRFQPSAIRTYMEQSATPAPRARSLTASVHALGGKR